MIGAPGSGKSTICKYLFGIGAAVPGEDASHVTTELIRHASDLSEVDIVDTVGKMPE